MIDKMIDVDGVAVAIHVDDRAAGEGCSPSGMCVSPQGRFRLVAGPVETPGGTRYWEAKCDDPAELPRIEERVVSRIRRWLAG